MNLFQHIPEELFSILSSPNRVLYAEALEVLYLVYQDALEIPEEQLYTALRGNLEEQLAEATFDEEDIFEEERGDVSGRARFLIRKLTGKGWIEKARGKDFKEYIHVPEYSSKLIELLHALSNPSTARGYSYVYGTYSLLKTADESGSPYEKMTTVYSAYDNTRELIKLLKTVYHNIQHYFKLQIQLHDVNQILASHFDEFGQRVVETYIRPLKIRDSVPKYRVPIQAVLDRWLEEESIITAMANAALQDQRGENLSACRTELLRMIYWIKERYEALEQDYLEKIDIQVRRYTKATTQKLENLTNRDENVRGNLNYLLSALSRNRRSGELVEHIQGAFQIYEQSYLSEKSLWTRKRGVRRKMNAPVSVSDTIIPEEAAEELRALTRSRYGKAAVRAYMEQLFAGKEELRAEEMELSDDFGYIMSLLAVVNSADRGSFYTVDLPEEGADAVEQGQYRIPALRFRRKEGK